MPVVVLFLIFVALLVIAVPVSPFGQKGDPYKAAQVIVSTIEKEDYPKMILLGKGTTNLGVKILSNQIDEIKKWKDISD